LIPIADWPSEKELPGAGLLSLLLMEENATPAANGVRIPHDVVASLGEDQAHSIGLPPAIPHALQLRSSRTIDEPDFSISIRWLRHGATPININRTGAIGFEGDHRFRIPGRLLTVLEAIESFQSADTETREARVEHWAPIQDALAATMGQDVRADGYLDDLRIFHAASLSLAVELSQEKGITFEPVLFGRADIRRQQSDLFEADPLADPAIDEGFDDAISTDGVDTLIDQADALLPGELQRIFVEDRLGRDATCREAYPLVRNTYVIIDAPLRKALNVVKEKRQASEDEKRAFVKNPRTTFADALGAEADDLALHGLLVETKQYADWVNGVGLWQPRVLPWLPRSSTSWLPEKIGFTINGQNVEIQPEKLAELKEACEDAIAQGRPSFDFEDLQDIPATVETLSAIESLQTVATRMAEEKTAAAEKAVTIDDIEASAQDKFAVEADDNLEELQFKLGLTPREASIELVPPREVIDPSKLYPHQLEGFDWTVRSWMVGRPGILVADDMGLGKTIQTLAFAAWLDANDEAASSGNRGPILIVAPTALLQNWREEHDKHLSGGGVGPLVELYGGGIRSFKKDTAAGQDVVEGYGVLDRHLLARTSCLLTTYETLANYQISFAGIRYPLVIFDEIQKLKTPTTINTHAAKTLNADFVIGLTGTPVENSLTELWSIMDRLHPGYLGDLKSFTSIYRADDTGSLSELRDQLVKVEVGTSVMLRRMKDTTDLGQTLPARNYIPLP
jgi:hypothetical protein